MALLGPSGSGKTTCCGSSPAWSSPTPAAAPSSSIDENVADRDAANRQVGFVFQHYALFRHMTVFQNVAFGLRVRPRQQRPPRNLIKYKVMRLLKLVQLEHYANRYPNQLSGGQRQRVALARALAIEPQVLLLDEPFGALDAQVRQELRQWLRRLHDEIHLTSVFVTHDQDEALELADRVLVMNAGRIEQIGTPDEVFHHPRTEFVVKFLGQVNPFHGRLEDGKVHFAAMSMDSPRARRRAEPAGAGLHPPARHRRRHSTQRPSLFPRRGDADPLRRAERAGGPVGRIGRMLARRADAGALPGVEPHHRQPGLRHAPRGEGLFQRGVRSGGQGPGTRGQGPGNSLGTVPIFVPRKWDCPPRHDGWGGLRRVSPLPPWGGVGYNAGMIAAREESPRWYRLTPDRVVVAMLLAEGLLWLSERFRWFPFNQHKGWTVLIAVASVAAALLAMALWFLAAFVFRRRFQFSIRALLLLMVVVAAGAVGWRRT